MKTIMSALFASALAVVAVGCGDDTADCPAAVTAGGSCTASGLACSRGADICVCTSGVWDCGLHFRDMSVPDLSMHDMRPSSD